MTVFDYNSYLLTQSDIITKLKVLTPHIVAPVLMWDFNDPTGAYSNVPSFATDGTLAKEEKT